jgi:hypothetical protein
VGLIQWLEREKNFQKENIRDTTHFGSAPRGFKNIDNSKKINPSKAFTSSALGLQVYSQ